MLAHRLLQKESPSDVQLHLAAIQGDVQLLRRILDSGKVHVDSKDTVRAYWVAPKCTWPVKDWMGTSVSTAGGCSRNYNTPHTRVKHSVELGPSYPVVSPLTESQLCFCSTVKDIVV
jgi:hypothetical protein